MTYRQIYNSSYSKIVRESVLKSVIFGFMIGLAAATVVALATMFIEFNGIWIALGACAGVTVICALVFYFVKFRPNEKIVAEKLDRMGFDERFITMLELDGDESCIARLQRADTVAAITSAVQRNGGKISGRSNVADKLADVGLTTRNMIIAAIVVVVAVVSLTFTSLPTSRVKEIFTGIPSYAVEYGAGNNGFIVSEANGYQINENSFKGYSVTVKEGDSAGKIVVTANDGYVFAGWDNGDLDPSRNDANIKGGHNLKANYEEMEEPEDEMFNSDSDGDGDGNGDPGQKNPNAPPNGEADDPGNSGDSDFSPPSGDGSSAGDSDMNNTIIDGETDYKEHIQEYYELAMQMLAEGKEIPPTLRKLIESYFGSLL